MATMPVTSSGTPVAMSLGGGEVWLLPLAAFEEAELLARARLTGEERAVFDAFLPDQHQRRKEWLAARVLAEECCGGRIGYHSFGRPFLVGSERSISISHTVGWVAVMVSAAAGGGGVDIERLDRDAARVGARIAAEDEIARAEMVFPQNPALLVWCAKEAAYKAGGTDGLDFRRDICVVDASARTLRVTVCGDPVLLEFSVLGDLLVVCGIV